MGLVGRGAGVALEGEVPPLVARALAGEVAALSGTAQAALQAAAVAGEPFDPDVIAQIAGVPESAALVALDELLDRDLVRETAVPRRFRFRHPLVRHAVYGSITGGCRLRAHARAGSVLAARGAGAVACAPHVEQSAGVGDEDAIALLAAAGAATAGRAPASSARWWEAALRLVPEYGPGSERAAQMRPQVAKALASAGRVNDAYATLLTALELVDAGDERASVPLIVACAGLESLIGEHERALGRLLAARAPVGDHSREAVTIELELAMYGAYLADLELLCEAAQRAQDGARVSGEAGLVASAMVMQAVARNFGGQRGPATSASEEAARLLAKLDDDELADRMGVVFFLAWAEWELGLLAVCDDRMEHAIALARSSGRADWLPHLTFSRTIAVIWLGKLDEARVVSQESVEAAEVNGDPYTRMQSQCATCLTLTAIGELEAAVRAGQQSVAIARTLSPSQYTASAGWACAWALVELGQPQRGIDVMFEMLGGPGLEAVFLGWRSYCYEALTRAELALGNQAQAEQWATLAASCAEEFGVAFAHACADRAAAETLLAAGAPAAAVVRAERAAAHADLMGARLDVARARLLAGRAYAAEGNRERAAEHLRSAELEFAACGALRLRDQTVRELRRIGLRVSRAGRRGGADARAGGVPSLSGREHEIATLVRDRKTNREIAGQLFLSEKTIESHMRNIFVKLGVDARAEVARRLERVES
jgi:DNA-binding CsgD family transcriptional regulator/tetratricopeptide (TPR) repeat protein